MNTLFLAGLLREALWVVCAYYLYRAGRYYGAAAAALICFTSLVFAFSNGGVGTWQAGLNFSVYLSPIIAGLFAVHAASLPPRRHSAPK